MKKQIRQHQKRELKLQRRRMRSLRGRRLGLYIHIPFCRRKCDYCDFYSLANSEDRMRDYIRALLLNLQELAPRTEGYVLDTISGRRHAQHFAGERPEAAVQSHP